MTNLVALVQQNPSVASAAAAMIAVIISLISIILTVAALWMQRRHNLKSVTPIANISFSDYENDVAVRISNSGIGPLIIRSLTVTQPSGNSANNIISLMPDLPDGIDWATYFENAESFAITPTNSITLIRLTGDDTDANFCEVRDLVRRRLSELTLTVDYRDIYGRRMPKKSRDLKWFGRHWVSFKSVGH